MKPATRAWILLLGLGFGTTTLATVPVPPYPAAAAAIAALILLLAWIKMRLILRHYLELARSPTWRTAFDWLLGAFAILLYGIYLIPLAAG